MQRYIPALSAERSFTGMIKKRRGIAADNANKTPITLVLGKEQNKRSRRKKRVRCAARSLPQKQQNSNTVVHFARRLAILSASGNIKQERERVEITTKPWENSEGYTDLTAYHGINNAMKEKQDTKSRISALVGTLKGVAELAGFEIVGRITFRDIETGREHR